MTAARSLGSRFARAYASEKRQTPPERVRDAGGVYARAPVERSPPARAYPAAMYVAREQPVWRHLAHSCVSLSARDGVLSVRARGGNAGIACICFGVKTCSATASVDLVHMVVLTTGARDRIIVFVCFGGGGGGGIVSLSGSRWGCLSGHRVQVRSKQVARKRSRRSKDIMSEVP